MWHPVGERWMFFAVGAEALLMGYTEAFDPTADGSVT